MSDISARPSTGPILEHPDVTLIGGGIMSATLGIFLKRLKPELTIQIIESLPKVALESSHAWNNAGTGHAALCELNYTQQMEDGSVQIDKALKINEMFENSKHFWSFLVDHGIITSPNDFIRKVPHMSFVWGEENQTFLKNRFDAMAAHHLFDEMEFSVEHAKITAWTPLLTQGRFSDDLIAATRVESGTDINFGALTKILIDHLTSLEGVELSMQTKVTDIDHKRDGDWQIKVDSYDEGNMKFKTGFVFIGAGGGSLPLLQKSGIREGKGFGGFPVSGQFLVCKNQAIVEQHAAKVYGKAAVGAPPMSVPHLDTRVIDGQKSLLFGPFAGFSPKFLKKGSILDLIKSVKLDNLIPMLAVGKDNLSLTEYLYQECINTHQDRCDMLREFFPDAKNEDWELVTAGQRVQIIKKDEQKGGILQFGTEVVASSDGSLSALLGASPGASTAVSIILEVLEKCFPKEMQSDSWKSELSQMVPAYQVDLKEDKDTYLDLRAKADKNLQIL